MSSETWDSPASSSSDMNGVVFQISETMIANIAGQWSPNQLVSGLIHGSQWNQLFDEAVVDAERELPGEGRDHGDDAVGDQDRGAHQRRGRR